MSLFDRPRDVPSDLIGGMEFLVLLALLLTCCKSSLFLLLRSRFIALKTSNMLSYLPLLGLAAIAQAAVISPRQAPSFPSTGVSKSFLR